MKDIVQLKWLNELYPVPIFFLGAGSNLLVSDKGIRGIVVQLQGDFRQITFDGAEVRVGAGVWMPTLAMQAAERGLAGAESLVGVPGTIGGGLVMNAGTRDGVMGDIANLVFVVQKKGQVQTLSRDYLQFAYRQSNLMGYWIMAASLTLRHDDPAAVKKRMQTYLEYRTKSQPLATNNCGSVFKNPEGHSAGGLIEKAGLKGFKMGGARISEKHANFIINEGGATAHDVKTLITLAQEKVEAQFNIHLDPEVKFVGAWDEH